MPLKARVEAFNKKYPQTPLKRHQLRKLYKKAGIYNHETYPREADEAKEKKVAKLACPHAQLRADWLQLEKEGYDIMQLGEATFSPKRSASPGMLVKYGAK